jgi:hypothetical protein
MVVVETMSLEEMIMVEEREQIQQSIPMFLKITML